MDELKNLGEPLAQIAIVEIFIILAMLIYLLIGTVRYFLTGKKF